MILREAANTWNYALFLIESKGYLICNTEIEGWSYTMWDARKGDDLISATCPLTLLALVEIREAFGANWKSVEVGDRLSSIDTILEKE